MSVRARSTVASILDRREGSVLVGLISIILIGAIIDAGQFLTLDTFSRIIRSAAPVAITGFGVALLMVTAEFDLSVGSMFGTAGAITALIMSEIGTNTPFAVLVALSFAVVFGITQGLLVTKLNLPSLIVTIGTLSVLRGVHRILLDGTTNTVEPGLLEVFGGQVTLDMLPFFEAGYQFTYQVPFIHQTQQTWNSFSAIAIWMLLIMVVFHYLLFYTRFGHHLRAAGDNVESVGTTGVDPEILKLAAFGICGLMAAFAGIAQFGRTGSVTPGTGSGLELTAIAAVVLGGTKLTGGRGSMIGVLLGALVLQTANTVLFLAGLGVSGWQQVITGGFIIAAIGIDVIFDGFSLDLVRRWYTDPIRGLLSSPFTYFEKMSVRKTTDEMFGFFVFSVGLAAVGANAIAWAMGGPLGFGGEEFDFKLFLQGNSPETAGQIYLFMTVLVVLAFFAITIVTSLYDTEADYEDNIAIVCYSTALAPLLAIPVNTFGFKLFFVSGPLISGIILTIPILAAILWHMYTGVVQLHELSRGQALATVGGVVLFWAAAAGVVALSLNPVA